ncbi:hypothetical protein ABT126_00945 [Streptomyces sp. NPDC002012]|uniref:hypothetical protein n=1 Tax=unclassified Streptomyces TaxID=2593676 RepID=UPI003321D616
MPLAGRTEPDPGPFLLIWGLVVIVVGGTFATKSGAARIRSFVVNGLEQSPRQQAKARAVPEGFLRCVGGFLAICGVVTVPVALVMMTRG